MKSTLQTKTLFIFYRMNQIIYIQNQPYQIKIYLLKTKSVKKI